MTTDRPQIAAANVFVGKGFTTRMAHSFFLNVDDGEIVSSAPPIQRLY